MNAPDIGLILVPVLIFLLGAIYGGIRGAIRFAQYLVRSEAAQADIARTNQQMATTLSEHVKSTDERLNSHDRRITVVETVVGVKP